LGYTKGNTGTGGVGKYHPRPSGKVAGRASRKVASGGLPAVSYSACGGLFAPNGAPKDIIGRLRAVEALADPAVQSRLAHLGMSVVSREEQTLEALSGPVKADVEKWWSIIKELRIKGSEPNRSCSPKSCRPDSCNLAPDRIAATGH
jgi:hypothetical protein